MQAYFIITSFHNARYSKSWWKRNENPTFLRETQSRLVHDTKLILKRNFWAIVNAQYLHGAIDSVLCRQHIFAQLSYCHFGGICQQTCIFSHTYKCHAETIGVNCVSLSTAIFKTTALPYTKHTKIKRDGRRLNAYNNSISQQR